MAKALLGYVAADNPHQSRERAVLRRRVADLEAEVLRLKSENDQLHAALAGDLSERLSTADLLEPAAG